jgi:hypothetical protein
MPSLPKEDDMEPYNGPAPSTDDSSNGSGEPDDSPIPAPDAGNLDRGKGTKRPANESLGLLGAGSPYRKSQ